MEDMQAAPRSGAPTVFMAVANHGYLDHVKALFSAARARGCWPGDFALIADQTSSVEVLEEWRRRGIHVLRVPREPHPTLLKLNLFQFFFARWDKLLYFDSDATIFRSLEPLLGLQGDAFCDPEHYPARDHFEKVDFRLYEEMCGLLPADQPGFNAGVMLLHRDIFTQKEGFRWARYLLRRFRKINRHGGLKGTSDQSIFNLLLSGRWRRFPNEEIHYWGKPFRGTTVAMHFCHWMAPWVNDEKAEFFQRTYRQVYEEDLAAFPERFPIDGSAAAVLEDRTLPGRIQRRLHRILARH